jgi:Arylsulfotransferase (ASST)/IPT/TIG domain
MRIFRPVVLFLALVAATIPVSFVDEPTTQAAVDTSPYALVSVVGSPLSDLTVSAPYALTPAFSPTTTDYVLRCNADANPVTMTLSGNGTPIAVGTNQQTSPVSGTSVSVSLSLVPNRAVVVYAPDPANPGAPTTQYWIRCLPPDFPAIQVNAAGPSTPGWTPGYYFTGNVGSSSQTPYAMVLDGNGVPVWYQALGAAAGGAINVQPLPNDTISWTPSLGPGVGAGLNGDAYTGFDLDTQSTIAPLPAATPPTDLHELVPLPNGDRLMISTPVVSHHLSGLGNGINANTGTVTPASAADNTIVDCVVQEVTPMNTAAWSWDAADHIGNDEVNTVSGAPNPGPPWILDTLNGSPAADIYHCNSASIDEDPYSPWFGDVLVSMRHLDALFLINPNTGDVIWKLGGTAPSAGDPEEDQTTPARHIVIKGDDESLFCGQHDARFVPTPNPAVEDVSLFDDQTDCSGAARGVEYAVDPVAETATLDYQYKQPQNLPVSAMGSFRRMPDANNDIGSGTSVIGWGISNGFSSGFTEVDAAGTELADIRFPDGQFLYRAIKVDAAAVNLALLRQTAGWTGTTIPVPPVRPSQVTGVSPSSGPTGGGTQVTISGSGFTAATSVTFGGHAAAFSVTNDDTIVAASPGGAGPGTVDIVVTAPGGASATSQADQFDFTQPAPPGVVAMAATTDSNGYWVASSDGRVFPFGDAAYYGSPASLGLDKPIVGMASTPDPGYWLVASDGGIFAYGDAGFFGSTGGITLNRPVVTMASTHDGGGYWLVATDGGIFAYGDAHFYGSAVGG